MEMKTMAHAATSVARSPLWLAVPAVLVLACVSSAVAQYEPLVFDASLYEVEESETSMEILDAAAIEEANLEAALAAAAESGTSATTTASSSVGELADGTWTGYAACGEGNEDDWSPYYVAVTIEVEDGAVTGVLSIKGTSTGDDGDATLNWKSSENQEYLDWAISGRTVGSISLTGVKTQLNTFIAQGSNPTSIDVVTGATYSSEAIFEAYYDALSKAAAAAGSTVETVELDDTSSTVDSGGSTAATVDSDADVSTLADGTWTGYAACGVGNEDDWSPYYVAVTITVENGVVTGIVSIEGSTTGDEGDEDLNWDADENEKYLTWAIDGRTKGGVDYEGVLAQLEASIEAGETPSSVDTVSGATYSSTAIFQAYYAALVKAAEAAGSTLELSDDDDSDDSDVSDDDAASEDADGDSDDDDDAIDADSVTTLADGTWTGYAACGVDNEDEWSPYYVAVTLTIEDGAVASIDSIVGTSTSEDDDEELNWDADENQAYLNWATDGRTKGGVEYTGLLAQLEAAIEAGSIATSVDAVSGATYSSDAIFQAYYAALVKAAEAAGSTLDMGDDDDGTSDGDTSDDDATGDDDGTSNDDATGDDGGSDDDDADSDDDADDDDSDSDIELIDGTYLGAAFCQDEDDPSAWSAYYVIVKITVEGGAITEITSIYGDSQGVIDSAYIYSTTENGTYLNRAIAGTLKKTGVKKQIQNCLDAGEEVTDIDAISGATWSSEAIVNAYTAAAELAWETAVAVAEGSDDAETDSSVILIKIYGDDGLYATMAATTDEEDEE